ncbi:hypothetical protein ACFQBQ_17440 [Granulicella cerasi]|uniref:Uncharacterized protein n=1 Tax=Granulicella cerasi TaxID=741063 RepID=A0ABW1ZF24_9BACT|nr:hypothetical protein [Granulicella cerasi]
MANIRISVNGLAEFMKAGASRQRAMLRNYKFQFDANGHKRPQIVRYSEARAAIKKFHESGNDMGLLISAAVKLQKKEAAEPDRDSSRLRDNIRAIESYATHFGNSKFQIIDSPKPVYTHGTVDVTATPDLYVDDQGTPKIVKLHFSRTEPDQDHINIVLKVMHEAVTSCGINVHPRDVIYLDIARNRHYTGAKLNKRLKSDIDAACDTIADIWPKITQTTGN